MLRKRSWIKKGRRLLWGWMGLGDTSPEYSNPTVTRGWQHAATLPRELSFNGQRLIQQPLPEYQNYVKAFLLECRVKG